jgi:RNA polymerase sigma factor (sigma-70 family)
MATAQAGIVLRHLRGLVAAESTGKLPDRQLLERFTQGGEQAAFETLVRRHGPLVLGLCRRLLHSLHDAEDAFQATFLVLARKAAAIARSESLGSWLYKVAYRVALKARERTAARQLREQRAGQRTTADPLAEITGRELLTVLDEELRQLPERYRTPLVLYHLQGKTREQVAGELGWSLRTLRRRLEQGRECLRARLKRRHLDLPVALLMVGLAQSAVPASVPPLLQTATVQAALQAATGRAAASAASTLADGMLHALAAGNVKLLAAVALTVAALAAGAGWFAYRGQGAAGVATAAESRPAPGAGQKAQAAQPRPQQGKDAKQLMTISGRVLDAAGKPVAGAQVAVLARQAIRLSSWENWAWSRNDVLGQVKTDGEGRYVLKVPPTAAVNFRKVRVVAVSPGHGLGWQEVDPKARTATAEVRLAAQQTIRGRLVDLQGAPTAGVKVFVVSVTRKAGKGQGGDEMPVPQAGLPLGIHTAATDALGHFTLAGFGANVKLELEIRDLRYARQDEIEIDVGDRKQAENFRLVLPPPRIVEGRVTYADTGKPVAGASLEIVTAGAGSVYGKTDAAGRYRLGILPSSKRYPSKGVGVHVRPPQGEPYLNASQGFRWPGGAVVRRTMDLALPRGVVVRGKVTEAGTGRPLARVYVAHSGQWYERVASGKDGTYRITVPSGKGQLLVTSSVPDYIPQIVGTGDNRPGQPVGDAVYYHAVVDLDVKAGEKERQVPITLRRGVTLKGRLVGSGDRPVASAVLFVGLHRPPYEKTMHPIHVRDGRFEIPGCDPAKTYRLTILEHPRPVGLMMGVESLKGFGQLWLTELLGNKGRLGAVVEVAAGKAARKPVVVRLAPCGAVKLRFRDAAGKPVANYTPWLQLVVTPGPTIYDALEKKTLAAEVVTLVGRYGQPADPHTDAQGFLTYQGLIPGAIYRLKKTRQEPRNEVLKDFTVEAGKTAEVDVVVK